MKSKAFTLIELLVVISIIGVISSIVLVSFSGQRDKARLARAQQFDAQISHALGAYAVGIWRFEEGSGIDIHDESGYGNDGTFSGNPTPVFPDGVYSGTKALEFDGSNDYINIAGMNFNLENISFWFYAPDGISKDYAGYYPTLFSFNNMSPSLHISGGPWTGGATNETLHIWNGSRMRYIRDEFTANTWHHVSINWNGSTYDFYVNGELKNSYNRSGYSECTLLTDITSMHIGNNYSTYRYKGTLDNVRIYNQALSSSQIQQHYAAGAPSHGIAVND